MQAMPPREPDPILPDLPEDPDTAEVRAERLWMAGHRVSAWSLERALPCVRPARPEELRDPATLLMFRDRKARLGIFRAAVLARPPSRERQALLGVVDPARLAEVADGAPRPFPSLRAQPEPGADGGLAG
jgi:hypothetical protein